ncbi:MAG TPA: hypothetical protein VNE39_26845 [Planctomycetota bacterium]|nr:hypothetical protein [Planctomycetota bacterium]
MPPVRRWKAALVGWGALLLGISAPLGGAFAIPALVAAVAGLWWLRGNHEHDLARGSLKFALVLACFCLVFYAVVDWWLFGEVRTSGLRMRCRNNMGQICKALTTYAMEGDGRLPEAANWCDALYPKMLPDPSCFRCPQLARDTWKPNIFFMGGLKLLLGGPSLPRCTYGFNAKLSGARLKDLPPDVVLLFETHGGWNQHGGASAVVLRHYAHTQVLFADSHKEMRTLERMTEWRWEP